MVQLTTPQGWTFNSAAYVKVGDKWVDVDELNAQQKQYVATKLNEQALNAAYAGKRVYHPETPLPLAEEVFPELKK